MGVHPAIQTALVAAGLTACLVRVRRPGLSAVWLGVGAACLAAVAVSGRDPVMALGVLAFLAARILWMRPPPTAAGRRNAGGPKASPGGRRGAAGPDKPEKP